MSSLFNKKIVYFHHKSLRINLNRFYVYTDRITPTIKTKYSLDKADLK